MLIQKSGDPSIKSRVPSKGSINQYSFQDFLTENGIWDDSSERIGVFGVNWAKKLIIY